MAWCGAFRYNCVDTKALTGQKLWNTVPPKYQPWKPNASCFVLRALREDDVAFLLTLRADPAVYRCTTARPVTEEEAWHRYYAKLGHWQARGYGSWAIEDKVSSRFVGETGFTNARRAHSPKHKGWLEAGWWLAADQHGKGYTAEIVHATHAWFDIHFETLRTFCVVNEDNPASLKVAIGAGYVVTDRVTFLDKPAIALERFPSSRLSSRR